MDLAEVELLWIAEDKPDRFSALIQWFLNTPYSHCAVKVKSSGMIWHAIPGGVQEQAPAEVMRGCHIVAARSITLKCTDEELLRFLESERGKPYAHRGNVGLLIDKLPSLLRDLVMVFSKRVRAHRDEERNCSEFMGVIVHKFFKPLKGRRDGWTPLLMEKWMQPKRYTNH